jgi:hypothetical protein
VEQDLPSLIEKIVWTFVEDHWLYRNEIYSKALENILEPILGSGMVCLSIFGGVVVTYVSLICLSICFYGLYYFAIC